MFRVSAEEHVSTGEMTTSEGWRSKLDSQTPAEVEGTASIETMVLRQAPEHLASIVGGAGLSSAVAVDGHPFRSQMRGCSGGGGGHAPRGTVPVDEPFNPVVTVASTSTATTALPLRYSFLLAATYTIASMIFFLLVRYSKSRGFAYNNASVVFAMELAKLSVSVWLKYQEDGTFLPATVLLQPGRGRCWRESLPYAVPSFLYALYNNLTFVNLNLFEAGTYQVFMQTRILFTGVLFSLLLHQHLSLRKWAALVLLMIGVASKYLSPHSMHLNSTVLLMLLQALLSSAAGVYNEYVLKKERHLSIHQQNFFMYLYALVFNAAFGLFQNPALLTDFFSSATHPVSAAGTAALTNTPLVMCIILFGTVMGLSAAFILKFINVIVKAFASAVEVVLTTVVAAVLLGEALTVQDLTAASMVTISVYLYYTSRG